MKARTFATLILMGYWHSESEPDWPDPAWFVDHEWEAKDRSQVIDYLRCGQPILCCAGPSWCRFQCETMMLGNAELTDGRYLWPAGLAHYLEAHYLRLPEPFMHHALSGKPTPLHPQDEILVETDWWLAQKGWKQGSTVRRPFRHGRIYLVSSHSHPTMEIIRFLQQLDGVALLGTAEIVRKLRSQEKMLVSPAASYQSYLRFQREAQPLGIQLDFQELDH